MKAELVGGAGHLALGLENDGFLCAQVFGRVVEDELHILNIAVDRAWRRHGLASKLLEELFQKAAGLGVETAFLEVRSSNVAAHHLYDSLGFKRIGVRKAYYPDTGEDAVVMSCKLNKVRKPPKTQAKDI